MKKRWAVVGVMAWAMLWPAEGWTSGYAQNVQGASSAGVAGAVTGRPNLPEAGYYNPAGWVLQGDMGAAVGGSFILPFIDHEDPNTGEETRSEVDGSTPPYLYGYGKMNNVAVGVYMGVPFGAGLKWPDDWAGRFEVTSTELRALEVAPSVAYRPVERIAFGVGPRLVRGSVGHANRIDFAREGEEGLAELEASAFGVGVQAGVWAELSDSIAMGASWRSRVDLDFRGEAVFSDIPPEMEGSASDTGAETTMVLPHRWVLGLAYQLEPMGILSLDLEYRRWGAYETFEVRFDDPDIADIEEERGWDHTIAMRAGVEYRAPVDGLTIRSGLAIEPSPAPAETLTPAQPDADRTILSLGGGFEFSPEWRIDGAYNFMILDQNSSQGDGFEGIYDGQIHVFSLGLSGRR